MTVHMIGRELDDIVRELYVLPPADFVTARNELARQARAAGSREVAERLQIPEKTLAQWACQRKGPPYRKFGRHTRYRLSECIVWENAQQAGGDAA